MPRPWLPPKRLGLLLVIAALGVLVAPRAVAQRRGPGPAAAPSIMVPPSDGAEAAVRAAYSELTGLLYAPPSDARDQEMSLLLSRYVDFEEMTRRFFGEPCPDPGCVDHWADMTVAQRIEIEGLVQSSLTEMWTRDLANALDYDVEIKAEGSRRPEARVHVVARPKRGSDPNEVIELFFVPGRTPYRLVDVRSHAGKLATKRYKQYDKILTNTDQGYPFLARRLGKRTERDAAPMPDARAPAVEPAEPEEPDAEPPAEPEEEDPPATPPAAPPVAPGPSWWKLGLAGAVLLAIGVGLGRRRGAAPPTPPKSRS